MSDASSINAAARDRVGKGAARAARRQGQVPGVIYGDKKAATPISFEPRILWAEMNRAGFRTRLYDVQVGSATERCLFRDVQTDPVTDRPLHVDLMRVSATSRIHVRVPVHFTGQEKSPGIKRGGVLNVVNHEIEVVCLASAIPEYLSVDVSALEIGHSIHLGEVALPSGVTPATHFKNVTVATVAAPTVQTETVVAAAPTEAEAAAAAAAGEGAAGAPAAGGAAPAAGAAKAGAAPAAAPAKGGAAKK
ncbi:MAG TPA: 50S ribosomal protein L25/general stress protein Ctc [Magnetospirillaceae bacterium]